MSESGEGKTLERIKSLLAVVPSPQTLRQRETVAKERRIRLRYNDVVKDDEIYVSRKLAEELGISSKVSIAVPGKRPLEFKAVIDENVPPNEVWGNPMVMRSRGIADGSIVTVRGA